MAFTDEDLKRLKKSKFAVDIECGRDKTMALLARLEAAEKDLEAYEVLFKKLIREKELGNNQLAYIDDLLSGLQEWRKEEGK